jgi:hypothetical protein
VLIADREREQNGSGMLALACESKRVNYCMYSVLESLPLRLRLWRHGAF